MRCWVPVKPAMIGPDAMPMPIRTSVAPRRAWSWLNPSISSSISSAVRTGQGRAEDRHQAVAEHLVDDAAVAPDRVEGERVVAVQQVDGVGRRERLGHPREPPDV